MHGILFCIFLRLYELDWQTTEETVRRMIVLSLRYATVFPMKAPIRNAFYLSNLLVTLFYCVSDSVDIDHWSCVSMVALVANGFLAHLANYTASDDAFSIGIWCFAHLNPNGDWAWQTWSSTNFWLYQDGI